MKRFGRLTNLIGLIIALPAIYLFFCWKLPSFRSLDNVETIGRQSVITVLVALGLTYVIVAAGIDLSVGSVVAFSCVAVALAVKAGIAPWIAALIGIGLGTLAGAINGVLITKLRVVPFIVTLGSLSLFRGAAKGLGNEQSVYPQSTWLNNILDALDKGERWKIFPVGVWITIAFAVFTGWVLRYTRFGRHVVAVGSNEQAARLCGVPIDRIKISVYTISGFFAGLAGLMAFSRLTIGDPTTAVGLELDGIAAVVVGGASLNGGEGSILGTVLGALIMETLRSGASQWPLPNWVQEIVIGAIIVMAVALDRFRKK
ncbi:MAG TPA: ABC transporter permease [Fimbriimonas sp.]|nr:ABC transporter permease [Fimbriimonas sp.]